MALRDINKKGVEIGERQNRCHIFNELFNIHIGKLKLYFNGKCTCNTLHRCTGMPPMITSRKSVSNVHENQ